MAGNVPEGADEHELRCHFSKFGDIESTDLVPGGRARVAFRRRADAQKAIAEGTRFHPDGVEQPVTLQLAFVEAAEQRAHSTPTISAQIDPESIKTVITIADDHDADDGKATTGSESTANE